MNIISTDQTPDIRITQKTVTKDGKMVFVLPHFLTQYATIPFVAYNGRWSREELIVGTSEKNKCHSNIYRQKYHGGISEGEVFHMASSMLLDIFPLTIDISRHSPFPYTSLDYREVYIILGYQFCGEVAMWIWDATMGFAEFVRVPGLEISSSGYTKPAHISRLRPVIRIGKEDSLYVVLLDCGRSDYTHYFYRKIPDHPFAPFWEEKDAALPVYSSLDIAEKLRSSNIHVHFPSTRERAGSFFRVLRMGKKRVPRKMLRVEQ